MSSLRAGITAVLAATLLVSSCNSSTRKDHIHPSHADEPVVTGEPAGYNDADVTFADTVIAQDQQGIDAAMLVPSRSTNSDFVTFSATSVSARRSEVTILKVMKVQWNSDQDDASAKRNQATTKGMIDPPTIGNLHSLRGAAFETLWLQSMVGLDRAGIDIANAEIANGKNVDAVGFAKQIVDARQPEIDQLKKMTGS